LVRENPDAFDDYCWDFISRIKMTKKFMRDFQDKLNWDIVLWHSMLSSHYVNKFKHKIADKTIKELQIHKLTFDKVKKYDGSYSRNGGSGVLGDGCLIIDFTFDYMVLLSMHIKINKDNFEIFVLKRKPWKLGNSTEEKTVTVNSVKEVKKVFDIALDDMLECCKIK
jgi:hypothetical protein